MDGKLSFGFLYDFRNPSQWFRPWDALYGETFDVIAETERLGYRAALLPEHHFGDDGYLPSPVPILGALATRTRNLRLVTGIALAPLYNPVRFAEDCALIDIISNGRLDVGLGVGYRRRETGGFGVDFTRRGARFDEFLEIVTRLWAGETVSFAGKQLSVDRAKIMPPVTRGRIPLYIGGSSDKALERVARYADGYIGTAEVCDLYVSKLQEKNQDPAASKVRIMTMAVVAEDPEAALHELAPYYLHINNAYAEWADEDRTPDTFSMTPMSLEEFKANRGYMHIMTPDEAIAMLKDYQARMPLELFAMSRPPGLPADRFLHYAEVFAKQVMPAFA